MPQEQRKEYMRKYCAENKERMEEHRKRWRMKNPDKIREYTRRSNRKRGVLPMKEYLLSIKKTKDEQRITSNACTQRARLTNIAGLDQLISGIHCADCNLSFETFPWLAIFHHESDRSTAGRGLKTHAGSITRLFKELNKGVFLCPNCHSTRHFIEDMTGIIEVSNYFQNGISSATLLYTATNLLPNPRS